MANYLLIYTGPGDMPESKEEMDAVMAAWGAWMGGLGDKLVDGGNPTSPVVKHLTAAGAHDGAVGVAATGYSIISADNYDEALELAKGCPVLSEPNASITVYETFEVS